ncbi:MAG: stage II sporulation protein R [Clostridia bacterium]|nr:stage II sporulation protein R [Clostridia bacterium]
MMQGKRILIAFLVLSSVLLFVGLMPVHGEAEIYDTVVRLHVLANSDSAEDQALKLEVRDAVLGLTAPMLEGCKTQEEALSLLEEHMDELQVAAEAVIRAKGYDYPVHIALGLEEYPERNYDSFCFPGGEYTSMRICIGEAEGQNWWCCLFPPLCLGAATVSNQDAEDACISVGLTPSQYKIITETEKPVYRVRFRLLELFQSWW